MWAALREGGAFEKDSRCTCRCTRASPLEPKEGQTTKQRDLTRCILWTSYYSDSNYPVARVVVVVGIGPRVQRCVEATMPLLVVASTLHPTSHGARIEDESETRVASTDRCPALVCTCPRPHASPQQHRYHNAFMGLP